jgi:SAM-dependent methyltransferase
MSALGWQASGLEPSREAVSAGQRIGLDIQQGTALNHPWEPETFDFIYSHHSFEHVPDPLATLKGLTMLLRPGGRLLIVQPDASGCCAHFGRYWGGLAAPVHIHLHTAKSMQILASQSGLEIEYQKTKDNPHDVISTFLFLMGFSLAKPHILFMTLATRAVTPVLKAVARVGLGCDLVTLFHKTPV